MIQITLLGKPQSTNNLYKARNWIKFPIVYMTTEWKDLKNSYILQARSQYSYGIIEWDVETYITLYFWDKRIRDIDNWSKILLDSLSWIVWKDDKQIQKQTVEKRYDKENPRIIITIKPI